MTSAYTATTAYSKFNFWKFHYFRKILNIWNSNDENETMKRLSSENFQNKKSRALSSKVSLKYVCGYRMVRTIGFGFQIPDRKLWCPHGGNHSRGDQSMGSFFPYILIFFWKPCKKYVLTVHVSGRGQRNCYVEEQNEYFFQIFYIAKMSKKSPTALLVWQQSLYTF